MMKGKQATLEVTADRELVIRRTFLAPRAFVYAAWINPWHIVQWWGPNGFTTTTKAMEPRPGGHWSFVMHGPDGRDYLNYIRYLELKAPERLVYEHGDGESDGEVADVHMHVTVTFADLGGKTEVTLCMVFPTAEERDRVVREYGAIEGGEQTLERLAAFIAQRRARRPAIGIRIPADTEVVFERTLNAPRDLVFKAWTSPEHLSQWFGCEGTRRVEAALDLRVGGAWRVVMHLADGQEFAISGVYHTIAPPETLVFSEIFEAWPENEARVTLTLSEEATGRTKLRLHSVYPDAETLQYAIGAGVVDGRGHSLDMLAEHLEDAAQAIRITYPSPPELRIERTFDAPRELVWRAMTVPALIEQWYGCDNTARTEAQLDLRVGGAWRFRMTLRDGQVFVKTGEILELEAPARVQHTDSCEQLPDNEALVTQNLVEEDGRTRFVSQVVYKSADALAKMREMGMEQGITQTFNHLARLLARLRVTAAAGDAPLTIVLDLDAPLEKVWRAWTETEHLRQWWGPKGLHVTQCTNDPRVGGVFHYRMGSGDCAMWGKWIYSEIEPQRRLVFVNSFADPSGATVRAPFFDGKWPLETRSTVTFEALGDKTRLTLRAEPLNADDVERQTFIEAHDSMRQGNGGMFEQLVEYLPRI